MQWIFNFVFSELAKQRASADPQEFRSLLSVAPCLEQVVLDRLALQAGQRHARTEPRTSLAHLAVLAFRGKVGRQEFRKQDRAAGLQQRLLQDALKLPDVARPGVIAQTLQCLQSDFADLAPEFAAE